MDTIYDLSLTTNSGQTMDLAQFQGQPILVVNTASKCGFAPQYDGLQTLHETYGPQGLVVLGSPAGSSPTKNWPTMPRKSIWRRIGAWVSCWDGCGP